MFDIDSGHINKTKSGKTPSVADPDPAFRIKLDPDPTVRIKLNPDPTVRIKLDPDPVFRIKLDTDPTLVQVGMRIQLSKNNKIQIWIFFLN